MQRGKFTRVSLHRATKEDYTFNERKNSKNPFLCGRSLKTFVKQTNEKTSIYNQI